MKTEAREPEIISLHQDNFLRKATTQLASLQRLAGSRGTRLLLVAGLAASSTPVITGCDLFIDRPQLGLPTEVPPNTGGNGYEGPRLIPTSTIAAEALKTPTLTPTPKPTQELPTPTPNVKKEVPCAILPDKYCSQVEIIEWTFEGQTYKFAAFPDLPPKLSIRNPYPSEKGYLASGKASDPFAGHHADVRDLQDPTSTDFSFEGYFQMVAKDGGVQKDEVIAQTTEVTGKKIFGRYSLVVGVTRLNPNGKGFITDESLIDRIIPSAKGKLPSQYVTQEGEIKPTTTYTFAPPITSTKPSR